jgi:hypothetical protein
MSALQGFITFWKEFYSRRPDPAAAVQELLGDVKELYPVAFDSMMEAIGDQAQYYPEHFYGFFGEENVDTSNDVLGLFMNPGPVTDATSSWNDEVVKQYIGRTPDYFLQECGVKDKDTNTSGFPSCTCHLRDKGENGCNEWRRKRFREIRQDLGFKDLRFLHSMELFPYHSQNFDSRITGHLEKIVNLPFMQLALNAVKEMAVHNKVRAIIAVGATWERIFDAMEWYHTEKKEFTGQIKRVAYYQASPTSSPVIVIVRYFKVSFKGTEESNHYLREILHTENLKGLEGKPDIQKKIEQSVDSKVDQMKAHGNIENITDSVMNEILAGISLLKKNDLNIGRVKDSPKSSYKYVHLWYSDHYWDENHYSIHIHVSKNCTYQSAKIEIRFGMNYKQLNFTESMTNLMAGKLEKIANKNNIGIKERKETSFTIHKVIESNPQIAIEQAIQLVSKLLVELKEL